MNPREAIERGLGLLLVSCMHATALTNEVVFEDRTTGFSLRLPDGWVEVPREMFHQVSGFGAKLEPTPPPREIRAVFQRGTNGGRPAFPRLVVHVQNGAPIGERQFRALHAAPLVEISVAQSLGFSGRPTFMRAARYNPEAQCLVFSTDCYVEDFGFIRVLGRSFLTADGLVNIYGYAPVAEINSFEPEFAGVAATIRVSPEHRYHPDTDGKQSAAEQATEWKQIGAVVGLIAVAGIGWIVYSRRRSNVYSDEI